MTLHAIAQVRCAHGRCDIAALALDGFEVLGRVGEATDAANSAWVTP